VPEHLSDSIKQMLVDLTTLSMQ